MRIKLHVETLRIEFKRISTCFLWTCFRPFGNVNAVLAREPLELGHLQAGICYVRGSLPIPGLRFGCRSWKLLGRVGATPWRPDGEGGLRTARDAFFPGGVRGSGSEGPASWGHSTGSSLAVGFSGWPRSWVLEAFGIEQFAREVRLLCLLT